MLFIHLDDFIMAVVNPNSRLFNLVHGFPLYRYFFGTVSIQLYLGDGLIWNRNETPVIR